MISNDTLLHDSFIHSSNLNSGPRRSQLKRLVTQLVNPLTIQLKEEITSGGKRKRMTAALRSRKSPKVSPSQVSSNDAATVERGRKALKTNEHDCSFQNVRSTRKTRKRSTAPCETSEIEAAINSSGEKISRRQHDPSEEMLIVF